jgi:hypothetical protein
LKSYRIQCLAKDEKPPECNSWLVSAKEGKNFTALGSVYFTDAGRLKSIWKYYDTYCGVTAREVCFIPA